MMVRSTDAGQKCQCPVCRGVIKHREQGGVVDDGMNMRHTDCVRDRYGHEMAMDRKWMRELNLEIPKMKPRRVAGWR